jgi:hypothetical protein
MSGIESLEDLDDDTLGVSLRQIRLEDLVKASFGGDRSAAGGTRLNKDGKGIRRRRMMRRVVRVAVRWMMRFGVCLVC